MTQTVTLHDTCDFLARHLVDVLETMLAAKAELLPDHGMPVHAERVSGTVGFAGDNVNGAVYLHLSGAFARRGASGLLGLSADDKISDGDVNDVVGEMANMLTGGLKSWLCDAGLHCAVSTPAIIRGCNFDIESTPDVERARLVFNCAGEQVAVEIHIKID